MSWAKNVSARWTAFERRLERDGPFAKAGFAGAVFSLILVVGYLALSHPPYDAFGYPFGRDFTIFWLVAKTAVTGHAVAAYDFSAQQQMLQALFGPMPQINWGYPPLPCCRCCRLVFFPIFLPCSFGPLEGLGLFWLRLR